VVQGVGFTAVILGFAGGFSAIVLPLVACYLHRRGNCSVESFYKAVVVCSAAASVVAAIALAFVFESAMVIAPFAMLFFLPSSVLALGLTRLWVRLAQ
jgi:hypothetical protein